ncbi:hypothetical protein J3F84DRAFT_171132 [Trichoderma pleuroticola]
MSARYSEKLQSPELFVVAILQLLERGGVVSRSCLSRLAAVIPNPVELRRHIRSRTINSQNLARGAHRKQTSHDDRRHLRASDDLRPGRDAFFIILISVPLCKDPCHLQMSPKYLPLPCFQPRAGFHITQKGKLSGIDTFA